MIWRKRIRRDVARWLGLLLFGLLAGSGGASSAPAAGGASIAIHKRMRVDEGGAYVVKEKTERWDPRQTAIVVCDMWDSHTSLNAARRVAELAPRLNEVLENARRRGVFIIHAPSDVVDNYKDHPARKRAVEAPRARELPLDIDKSCKQIPAELKAKYPIDQSDGGSDDDPAEHARWRERWAGMGRGGRWPWKAQTNLITIHDEDAISASGVEIWNLLERRGIRNVILTGVHTNFCVVGRPFGLRQMAKNGKNVVLMRDLTDSLYNPARWPYVTHFKGTDLVVEHIEKFIAPTITSVDFLGGKPFRFKDDRRSVLMIIGENEYKTETTLPAFAKGELEPRGFEVQVAHLGERGAARPQELVAAIKKADLILVSVRRRPIPKAQLDALRAHVAAGKPLVGIRTASHAWLPEPRKPLPHGLDSWPEFDAQVLGGNYQNHHANGLKATLAAAPGAADHSILRGIDITQLRAHGSLYKTTPLASSAVPLVVGQAQGQAAEPVAWTNTTTSGARVFYTSLGHPEDFDDAAFRRLLLGGLCWTLGVPAPGPREPGEPRPVSANAAPAAR